MDDLQRDSPSTRDRRESHWSSVEARIAIEYNSDTGTYHASYDSSIESVSLAIISTIATITESDPRKLEPLHSIVDPEALNNLFAPKQNGIGRTGGEVRFSYCGYEITATSNNEVSAVPTEE